MSSPAADFPQQQEGKRPCGLRVNDNERLIDGTLWARVPDDYSFEIALRIALTVVSARKSMIFLPHSMVFSAGANSMPLMRNFSAAMRCFMRTVVGSTDHHLRRDGEIVVQSLIDLLDPLPLQPLLHPGIVVILGDEVNARLAAGPLRVEPGGHRLHALLVAAAVADQDDVLEAVRAEAGADVGQQALVGLLGQADGAGILHVPGGRIDVPLGHERHDGGDQGVAELAGDGLGGRPQDVVVLAGGQVGAVLLDAAGRTR